MKKKKTKVASLIVAQTAHENLSTRHQLLFPYTVFRKSEGTYEGTILKPLGRSTAHKYF